MNPEDLDDEQLFKNLEQHNRNVNVVASLIMVAIMLVGVIVFRMCLMNAEAQSFNSEMESDFAAEVERFKQEIADAKTLEMSEKNDRGLEFAPDSAVKTRIEPNLFSFDPNTLDSAGFISLGIPPKVVATILKYRKRYGFRSVDNFFDIYAFRDGRYDYLRPYVEISRAEKKGVTAPIYKYEKTEYKRTEANSRVATLLVDINTADTAELRKLPGIGEKRALNIVKFRTSLGGFYSVDQLSEVYSIDDAVVERIRKNVVCDASVIKRIDINNTNSYNLWHPYLKGNLLKTLKHRIKSGKRYNSFDEIRHEEGYDEIVNGRAEKYLEFK
ncbi:MAG: helix-hairpin-helix domain-containing protein [Paludibacteraceae bacterium]|nr:helix-hairpin-helix domain-containing protein [Paludibacteraceae bacterium]